MNASTTTQPHSTTSSTPHTPSEFASSLARLRATRANRDRLATIDAAVDVARIYVDAGAVDSILDSWREAGSNKPASSTERVIAPVTYLTSAVAVALTGNAPSLTAIHGLLTEPSLSVAARRCLWLPVAAHPATDRVLNGHRLALTIGSVTRAFAALASGCDAASFPAGRALTVAEADHIDQHRDAGRTAVLQDRLDILTGRLCTAALQLLPSAVRDEWSGDVTIARLGVPVPGRTTQMKFARGVQLPREANAGWHVLGSLSPVATADTFGGRRAELGYVATIAVTNTDLRAQAMPNLIAGVSLNHPLADDIPEILTVLRGLNDAQACTGTVFDLYRRSPRSARRLRIALTSHGYKMQLRPTSLTTDKRQRRARAQVRAAQGAADKKVWAYDVHLRVGAVPTAPAVKPKEAAADWYLRVLNQRAAYGAASGNAATSGDWRPVVGEGRFRCPASEPLTCTVASGGRTAQQSRKSSQAEAAVHRLKDASHSLIRKPAQRRYRGLAKHTVAVAIDIAVHNINSLATFYAKHPNLDPARNTGDVEPAAAYREPASREPFRIAGRPGLSKTPRD